MDIAFYAQMHYMWLLPMDQELAYAVGVAEYNSLRKIHPHRHNLLSNENMK